MEKKNNQEQKKPPSSSNNLAKLSGIGIQMGVTIFIFSYGGKYLDEKYQFEKNWFTIGLTLLGVGIALYNVLKQVNRINQQ